MTTGGLSPERPPHILIVDDQEENLDLMEALLATEGHRVSRARDGEEALRAVAENPPDLILLDVRMPRMDGYAVCGRLKQHDEHRLIPVVMLTSSAELEDRIRGIESGADEFLTKPVHRLELQARVRSLLKLKQFTDELERAESVLFSLALTVEAKEPYTEGHCQRLAEYGMAFGRHLRLQEEQLVAIRRGGILHDLGKIAVPDTILLKAGSLTPEEWAVVREHPAVGERICQPLKSMRLVLPIIRHHHECWDGSGYPDGLQGEAIPLTARILRMVDVYDALTTTRPYRAALPKPAAVKLIEEQGRTGKHDPHLFREFLSFVQRRLR